MEGEPTHASVLGVESDQQAPAVSLEHGPSHLGPFVSLAGTLGGYRLQRALTALRGLTVGNRPSGGR